MPAQSKLGLGTVQFGLNYGISNTKGKTPLEEVNNIIMFARQNHIKYLDTASAYGDSEKVLGICGVEDYRVVSKFMPLEDKDQSISSQLNESLDKLGLKSVYGYLAHRPENLLEDPHQWKELLRLKELGKIEKIGFSLNKKSELEQLLAAKMPPDIVQVPFNVLDSRFQEHLIELKSQGCEIHSRSPFLQGLFFMPPASLREFFDPVKDIIGNLQSTYDKELPGALLNFVLQKEFIDVVILGVENLDQLKENIEKIENSTAVNMEIPYIEERILMPSSWPSNN